MVTDYQVSVTSTILLLDLCSLANRLSSKVRLGRIDRSARRFSPRSQVLGSSRDISTYLYWNCGL